MNWMSVERCQRFHTLRRVCQRREIAAGRELITPGLRICADDGGRRFLEWISSGSKKCPPELAAERGQRMTGAHVNGGPEPMDELLGVPSADGDKNPRAELRRRESCTMEVWRPEPSDESPLGEVETRTQTTADPFQQARHDYGSLALAVAAGGAVETGVWPGN